MPSELVPTDLENMKMTVQDLIHRKTFNVSHSFHIEPTNGDGGKRHRAAWLCSLTMHVSRLVVQAGRAGWPCSLAVQPDVQEDC
jgi:hypothetical protein